MAGNLAPNKKRGGLSPCGRQGHMGMDPNKSPPPDPCQNGRRKTHKPLAGFHASEHRTKLHLLLWNDFCHHVSCILVCVNLLQLESFLFCSITNPVLGDLGPSQSQKLAHRGFFRLRGLEPGIMSLAKTGLLLLRLKARCVRGRLLGYPTSVVEGVGDEFISVRESLIS